MSLNNTIKFVPEKLRNRDLNIKFTEILDFILAKHLKELEDVELKYRKPNEVSVEVVKEILIEEGLGYIGDLLDISDEIDPNAVLAFSGMISLLKGHIDGFKLVLDLLNIDFELEEWWEQNPKGLADTMGLTIDLDESGITNFFETFQKFKIFVKNYIFPILDPLVFIKSFDILKRNLMMDGFQERTVPGDTPTFTTNINIAGFVSREVFGLIT